MADSLVARETPPNNHRGFSGNMSMATSDLDYSGLLEIEFSGIPVIVYSV